MASDMEATTSIFEQASRWWELLHSDSASNADHHEFGEWVARSPERVEALSDKTWNHPAVVRGRLRARPGRALTGMARRINRRLAIENLG